MWGMKADNTQEVSLNRRLKSHHLTDFLSRMEITKANANRVPYNMSVFDREEHPKKTTVCKERTFEVFFNKRNNKSINEKEQL